MSISSVSRLGVVAVAISMVGVACGGDDAGSGSSSSDDYVSAIATSLSNQADQPFSDDELRCIAEGVIDVMGTEMFAEANLSPSDVATADTLDLPDPSAEQMTELVDFFVAGDCVDMARIMAEQMMAQSGGQLTEDQAKCLGDILVDSEGFAEAFASEVAGTDSGDLGAGMESDIMNGIMECDIPLDAFG
ncbi:MAG: hypothetical protein ACKOCE_02720 [Acidimicrobiia bacterium]